MIRSFRDDDARAVWQRSFVKRFGPDLSKAAYRKLVLLNAAATIDDLRAPPGNRLEKLAGDRAGQHSIRINDQWRICFTWNDTNADEVEITDYH